MVLPKILKQSEIFAQFSQRFNRYTLYVWIMSMLCLLCKIIQFKIIKLFLIKTHNSSLNHYIILFIGRHWATIW